MSKKNESCEEWLQEFGASPLTTQELHEMKLRLSSTTGAEVKHLIDEVELLRFWLKSLLEYIEAQERNLDQETPNETQKNQLLKLARFIISTRS